MSASTRATLCPACASAAARFTVTDDLPTPPLPLTIAYTLVSEDGWAKGMTRSGAPPRSVDCRSWRCSSLITSSSTRTLVTPASAVTAAVTRLMMVSRIGQPATVRYTATATVPSGPISTDLTMPSSVIGRPISGSLTPASAVSTCSRVGRGELMPHMLRAGDASEGLAAAFFWGDAPVPPDVRACAPDGKNRHRTRTRKPGLRHAGLPAYCVTACPLILAAARNDRPGLRVEYQRGVVRTHVEVEQAARRVKRTGHLVVGAGDRLAVQPVLLDELHHRGGVGQVVADVVVARGGGEHEPRQPLAEAAAVVVGADRDRLAGAERGVGRRVVGPVDDRRHGAVVPAVRVVVGDDDRGRRPVLGLLDRVDRVDQEVLLVGRVGVAGVAVLVGGGLEVAHRGQLGAAGAVEGVTEVRHVVLVVGLVRVADLRQRTRRQVVRVRGGRVVLERVVVRHVVLHRDTRDVGVAGTADGQAAGGRGRGADA